MNETFEVVDIRNTPVIPFLKEKWLQTGYMEPDEENVVNSSLSNLFLTYSQCYQFSILISKVINAIQEVITETSEGVHFCRAYIPTSLLKSYVKCILALPNRQALSLWELFIRESDTFFSCVEVSSSVQAGSLIITQLFSSFLCHLNMFDMMSSQVNRATIQRLIGETEQCLLKNVKVLELNERNNSMIQLSYMLLMLSYRKVRCTYLTFLPDGADSFKSVECCDFNFLPLHEEVGCDIVSICQPYLNSSDKRISYCMLNLLKEECVNTFIHPKDNSMELTLEKKKHLQTIMSLLTTTTVSAMSTENSSVWDMNITSLNSRNFCAAILFSYITHLPRFLNFVETRHLTDFSTAAILVLMQNNWHESSDNGITMRHCLTEFLKSNFFTESKMLQTAFVTSIWDTMKGLVRTKRSLSDMDISSCESYEIFSHLSKSKTWSKFIHTTPKGESERNKMWNLAEVVGLKINDALTSRSLFGKVKINESEAKKLIEIVNYLPLEYLLPGNQIRCLYGLTITFLILGDGLSKKHHQDSCNLAQIIIQAIVAIFEGVRSIWLFDLVEPVPYIRSCVKTISHLKKNDINGTVQPKVLFDKLFDLSTRYATLLLKLEEYLSELGAKVQSDWSSALAFHCLLQRLCTLLQRSFLQENRKEACIRMISKSCSILSECMEHCQTENCDEEISALLINSYTTLLSTITSKSSIVENAEEFYKYLPQVSEMAFSSIKDVKKGIDVDMYLSLIAETSSHQKTLFGQVPEEMNSKSWKALKKVFSFKCSSHKKAMESVLSRSCYSQLSNSTLCHSSCRIQEEDLSPEVSDSILLLELNQLSVTLSESETVVITGIVRESSSEELESIFKQVLKIVDLQTPDVEATEVSRFVVYLSVLETLLDVINAEDKDKPISSMLQEWLLKLHSVVNQTCQSPKCLIAVVLPSFKFLTFLLGRNCQKMKLPRQTIMQCVHSCIAVNIDAYVQHPVLFTEAFQAVWKVTSLMLSNYCYSALACRIALIPCVSKLLKSVVLAGNQDLVIKYEDETMNRILQCAENLSRLFAAISKYEIEFAKMVPYLIADYVDLIQNITLHPEIKSAIIAGINRLLNICNEEALKMLSVNINHSCREIFASLVKNYKSMRYVGQV